MSIQLTDEQERRIRTVVNAGAYRSTEEALDAAVTATETFAAPNFEGAQEKLEELLLEGINSGDPVEADEDFWNRLRAQTDTIAAEHQARRSLRES